MISFQDFINKYNGKKVGNGQCVALVKQYDTEVLGLPPGLTGGNAKDWFDNFINTGLPEYFVRVPNNGIVKPRSGDIIVWNGNVGHGYGHIAIFMNEIPGNRFQSFDQNWNTPKKTRVESHTWNNVSGWLVPKGTGPEPPTPPVPPTPPPYFFGSDKKNFKFFLYKKNFQR